MDEQDKERKARERDAHQKQLEAAARAALEAPGAEPLVAELRRIAVSSAYNPGRSKADMAHVDGKRATAVHILNLGGKANG